jgi:S1-C subfamily serine protease
MNTPTGRRSVRKAYLAVLALLAVSMACINIPLDITQATRTAPANTAPPGMAGTQDVIPTITPGTNHLPIEATPLPDVGVPNTAPIPITGSEYMVALFERMNPGVVSIQVYTGPQGMQPAGGGSGFVLDESGHIITNRHVVAGDAVTTVVFYNGHEILAEIIGVDADSDLAVLRVGELPEGVYPLPLGDSDLVSVGEWVVAIGNPFGLTSTLTLGIVSAVGRDIPTGVTPFSIPQAIQTDAAINPGNSGGPLINMRGEIIGVNAQIVTRGQVPANTGVGFAIPSNTVRRVAPVLIETGSFQWPWLGIRGNSLNVHMAVANNLDTQEGAYIHEVVGGSPAARAGLRGTSSTVQVQNLSVWTGGDVIVEADGQPIRDLSDLLVAIAAHNPGDAMELVVLRDGAPMGVSVQLDARPVDFEDEVP